MERHYTLLHLILLLLLWWCHCTGGHLSVVVLEEKHNVLSTTASLAGAIDDINSEIMTEEFVDYTVQLKHEVPITYHTKY